MTPLSWKPPAWRRLTARGGALLALLALHGCGGGGTDPAPPAKPEAALTASRPGELVAYVKTRLAAQSRRGADLPRYAVGGPVRAGAAIEGAAAGFAGTLRQEAGVGEADLIQTDGRRIYSLAAWPRDEADPGALRRLRADARLDDGTTRLVGSLTLPDDMQPDGLHLTPDGARLAVVGQTAQWFGIPVIPMTPMIPMTEPVGVGVAALADIMAPVSAAPPQTVIELVAADALAVTETLRIDGQLVGTRSVGNLLYVVTTWHPPFDDIARAGAPGSAARLAAIERLTSAQVLPTLRRPAAATAPPQALMAETDCYVQPGNASDGVQLTTVTVFDLASAGLERSSRCFVGGTDAIYMTERSLYLATHRYRYEESPDGTVIFPVEAGTDVHKFAIDGRDIAYRGTGQVAGHLGWEPQRNAYRLSEHAGDLRIVTYTGDSGRVGEPDATSDTASVSPARLTILREDAGGTRLDTVATLPNETRPEPLGLSGEQVYAVRFAGTRAYVVTFLRSDPLYVIDLADPADPRVAGALEVPGFSDQLLPIGPALLLGVGHDATEDGVVQGLGLALFDVADAAAPKLLARRVFGRAGSASALDASPRGISVFEVDGITRVALPVRVHDTASAEDPGWFMPSWQGLLRLDVDAAAGTLAERPALVGRRFGGDADAAWRYPVEHERAVHIGAQVHYLSADGRLIDTAW